MLFTAIPFGITTEITNVSAANVNDIYLSVISARTEPLWNGVGITKGTAVTNYKWIINQDNTGNPFQARQNHCSPTFLAGNPYGGAVGAADPDYPDKCDWPSIRTNDSYSKIVAQGDQTMLSNTVALNNLPNGKYLISVQGDGFKIDGKHFSIPIASQSGTTPGLVTVEAQPFPLPLGKVKLQVFKDSNPVNGQYDVPGEVGLAGFEGHLADVLGLVTNDWYGNPFCTTYYNIAKNPDGTPTNPAQSTNVPANYYLDPTTGDPVAYIDPANNRPIIDQKGGKCLSDANGVLTIPNIGPNRYTASVVAPNGQKWVQTTTLEGNHDWDVWVQEGATGFDTEQIGPNGEPVPAIPFGFVQPIANADPALANSPVTLPNMPARFQVSTAVTGGIDGRIRASNTYIPQQGGLPLPGNGGTGTRGTKLDTVPANQIKYPWIALNNLQFGDVPVYVGQGDKDGNYHIDHVPDGDYALAFWDDPQDFLFDFVNVTVANGQVVHMGDQLMAGWWTTYWGRVCIDQNDDGKCQADEPGVANQSVVIRSRANNVLERGIPVVTTNANGEYVLRESYPLTQWYIEEVYNDRFKTIGVTYQADNQPTETTVLGSMVDVAAFPVIGVSGRLDWAVKLYDTDLTDALGNPTPENGGIVGTVTYDTTRNELDAAYSVTETYQPGVPNVYLNLWTPVPCGTVKIGTGAARTNKFLCDPTEQYEIDALATDGSGSGALRKGHWVNQTITDQFTAPTGCVARDVAGNKLTTEKLLPLDPAAKCLEAPMLGVQFDPNSSAVDGNYAFTESQYWDFVNNRAMNTNDDNVKDPQPLPAGDYIVEYVGNKTHNANKFNLDGKVGQYQVTREEDVNIFTGDRYVPQIAPFPCVGAQHTVHITNQDYLNGGGNPYEGTAKPICDMKLVTLSAGRSSVTNINIFTEVPIPGRLWGLINDDLNLSTNPQDIMFGEKRGLANVPVGVYDYSNRWITTVYSDPNGFYNVLLPSTGTYNCPLPAGPCPNVYRLVGNDPGHPDPTAASGYTLDPWYNPQYRTISASFEIWPGEILPADHAPIPVGSYVATPGSQVNAPAKCDLTYAVTNNGVNTLVTNPQIFTVSQPYATAATTITIQGDGFGNARGTVKLGNNNLTGAANIPTWNDNTITVKIPAPTATLNGPMQLSIVKPTVAGVPGKQTLAGLTFHMIGGTYTPTIYEVGPGKTYPKIQDALDVANTAAAAGNNKALVVVYPGTNSIPTNKHGDSLFNVSGAYFENLLINSPVKLQGVGPGGVRAVRVDANGNVVVGATIFGSVIDGAAFGGEAYGDVWRTKAATLSWDGNQTLYEGAVVTVLAKSSGNKAFTNGFKASIDGFTITGGDQIGQTTKQNSVRGGIVITQGGGIFANAYADNLQITNNIIRSNGGAYGGAVRLGTPYVTNSPNSNVHIANNRIIANGGTNLAGGIGLFNGSNGYEIDHNDICGNYSGEYGGGISQYGFSNGSIHDNQIYFNTSFDEGGGIKIAGELPIVATNLSAGSGPVQIYNNVIEGNLANDDGGGIRFLMVNNAQMDVYNNMIVNNVSTHEGGGIALDDATNVRIFNNTIMKNITTATAATATVIAGIAAPAPAGISTVNNSAQLQATLPVGSPLFSNPLVFNNILWDNRAGTWNDGPNTVTGIGLAGDATPINYWDMGSADSATVLLSPTNSVIQSTQGTVASPTNKVGQDPLVKLPYDMSVAIYPWRLNGLNGIAIVALDLPPFQVSDYHLQITSPAIDSGASSKSGVNAPATDIDGQARPQGGGYDIGADEAK